MSESEEVHTKTWYDPSPPPAFSNLSQQYTIPPSSEVGERAGGTVTPLQKPAYGPQQDPAETADRVLALINPSRNQCLDTDHQPQMKRPWWMWAVATIEILLAVTFSCKVAYQIMTADGLIDDPNTFTWMFFLIFVLLAVQFMMGVSLLIGLQSTHQSTTLWCCQMWTCGAYFLFVETGLLLMGILVLLMRKEEVLGHKVLLILIKTIFRIVAFILVRRFMHDISAECRERIAAEDLWYWQYRQEHPEQFETPAGPRPGPEQTQEEQQAMAMVLIYSAL